MKHHTLWIAMLAGSLASAPALSNEPFDYDYLGITYDYERIGVEGYSEELAGHKVTLVYSEELKQGLIYQAFADTNFVDEEVTTADSQYHYEQDEITIGASLGTHLPMTAKADIVGSARLNYTFYDTYTRVSGGSGVEAYTESDEGSEASLDLSAGVRWFIDDYTSLDIQPLFGVILTDDESEPYFRGRASFRYINTMEVYLDMTTYLDSDYRAFGTGMFLYY